MKTITIIFMSFLLIGCSDSKIKKQTVEKPKILDVSLASNSKELSLNKKVTFTTVVKYGDRPISKGAEVQFEIIENNVSIGMVSPKNLGQGKYTLDTKFFEPGEKQVIAHVNYKNFHKMPALALQVIDR